MAVPPTTGFTIKAERQPSGMAVPPPPGFTIKTERQPSGMAVPPPPGFTIKTERQPSGEDAFAAQARKNDTPFVSTTDFHSPEAQVTRASAFIIDLGFDPAIFTANAVYSAGLTIHKYVKLACRFTIFRDRRIRQKLLSAGIRDNVIGEPGSATFGDVVNFLTYLKSVPELPRLQRERMQKDKLTSKGGKQAVVQIFQQQMNDFVAAKRALQMKHETEIAHIRAQLVCAERDMETALSGLSDEFHPASLFQEPNEETFKQKCYTMYEFKEQTIRGEAVLPRGAAGYAEACALYGDQLKDDWMASFANSNGNKEQLMEYMRGKILRSESEGQLKAGRKFRSILGIAGGDEALPDAAPAAVGQQDNGWQSMKPGEKGYRKRAAT